MNEMPESPEIHEFTKALFNVVIRHSVVELAAVLCASVATAASATDNPDGFKRMVCHVLSQNLDKVEVEV